ncbi:MAG: TlpA family protein disulfide reductase [Elusimicrobiota bacterium]|jgi:thiol-disulfide isomerase/thioredoxin|nr:TlpA family protein disulfide reductase [Elusimicrobiota bacterium]
MKKLLIVSLAVLAVAACGGGKADVQSAHTLPLITGGAWDFQAQAAQKPVFIAFMAGYCGFCKRMAPPLDKLAGDYKDKNVDIVFAYFDEDLNTPKNIAKDLGLKNALIAYNAEGLGGAMGVEAFPQMFLVDMTTQSAKSWTGYSEEAPAQIAKEIDALLAK